MLRIPVGDITALIASAGAGAASWDDVNAAVAQAIPGSMSALVCQSFQTGEVRFSSSAGIESNLADEYIGHYARHNPWNPYWNAAAPGTILDTLKQFPSSQFARSEFYNDWLAKLGDRRNDGIGIKLKTAHADMVFHSVQVPESILVRHGRQAKQFFRDISVPLVRAIEMNKMLGERIDRALVAGTLLARAGVAALVIDDRRVVLDINPQAETMLRDGDVGRCKIGRLFLVLTEAQEWLDNFLRNYGSTTSSEGNRYQFLRRDVPCEMRIHHLPDLDLTGYVFRRPLFLLQMDVGQQASVHQRDALLLVKRFGLSPAEKKLCISLAQGRSLAEAATDMQISKETVRDRLKAIFRKTDTHRQGELVALLLRLGL